MSNKLARTVEAKTKNDKWENPKIVGDPMKSDKARDFIEKTEGRENRGGDKRLSQKIKSSLSEKEAKAQIDQFREYIKRNG